MLPMEKSEEKTEEVEGYHCQAGKQGSHLMEEGDVSERHRGEEDGKEHKGGEDEGDVAEEHRSKDVGKKVKAGDKAWNEAPGEARDVVETNWVETNWTDPVIFAVAICV